MARSLPVRLCGSFCEVSSYCGTRGEDEVPAEPFHMYNTHAREGVVCVIGSSCGLRIEPDD